MFVADVLVQCLREAGVRAIFGVPGGGSNLDLIEAGRRAGLPFVLTATETAGATAAIAQAEISGRPGACITGLGPGVASVVNGVACASLDRAPLVIVTDAHPASSQNRYEHQRLDQLALLAPVTKWSATITADNVHEVMTEAIASAMTSPRGPVHIECSGEVASLQSPVVSGQSQSPVTRTTDDFRPTTDDLRLTTVRLRLTTVRRPLLIAGLGAREHAPAIRSFCASHNVPAMVTYKAKGVMPDRDVLFAGVFTNGAFEQEIVEESDLIVAAGLDRVELLPRPWSPRQPVVDLEGDVAAGLRQLSDTLPRADWDLDALQRTIADQRRRLQPRAEQLTADRVVRLASGALPDARVTVDAGAHMFAATMLWPIAEANGMLISNGLSTMGFAVPAAVGAAHLDRDRVVVALTGDGGLLMCAGDLLTLTREQLPVIVIVFNDGALSLIDVKQQQRRHASSGVALGGVAWASVAESFRMAAHVATTDSELERALAAARAHRGPTLIDAHIDPAPYAEMLRLIRG
jgi:acetolactate synthase I/II/III large subunit